MLRDTLILPETLPATHIWSTITGSYALLKVTKPAWVRLLPPQPPTQTQLIKLNINLLVTVKYLCKQPFIDLGQDYHSCRWLWDSSKFSGFGSLVGVSGFLWWQTSSDLACRTVEMKWSLCHFNPLSFYKHVRLKLSVELIDPMRIIG